MWSLTSLRAKRISGPKKFRSSCKKDFSTVSALFGHAAISELSLLSGGVKRKLDFEPAKGSSWREAAIHKSVAIRRSQIISLFQYT
jgi:hypothetical protein